MKLPAFQFYPGDWMKDPALRAVSLSARGLWMDLLCLMHESAKRGFLQLANGAKPTDAQVARMVGASVEEVASHLKELVDAGVCSIEGEFVVSRRMVRDEGKRTACSEAGRRGGNPALKGQSKGGDKGYSKGLFNPEITPSSSSSVSSSEDTNTGARVGRPKKSRRSTAEQEPSGFTRWYESYPGHKRVDPARCLAIWNAKALEAQAADLIARLEAHKRCPDWTKEKGQYVPNSSTYLHQERWKTIAIMRPAPSVSAAPTPSESARLWSQYDALPAPRRAEVIAACAARLSQGTPVSQLAAKFDDAARRTSPWWLDELRKELSGARS